MTTATTGTGAITLGSAVSGYLTFALAGVSDGDTVSYGIKDGSNSEVGTGVYTASGTTLTRSVTKSTNSDAAISLSGTAEVFITPSASDLIVSTAGSPAFNMINGSIALSVSSSALTIAVKTLSGADATADQPVICHFRNATLTSGDYVQRRIEAALSLTIASGATMGATSGVALRLWVGIVDDAGTLRLAVVNCAGTTGVMPLQPHMIVTTSGAAGNSLQTIYTGTAVTSKPFVPLGYIDFDAGLTTAGTWVLSSVSRLQLWTPGTPLPGQTVREWVQYTSTLFGTSSTSMVDVTGGSLSISPSQVNNPIRIDAGIGMFAGLVGATNVNSFAQFLRDSTNLSGNDAFQAGAGSGGGGLQANGWGEFHYLDYRRSVSSTTYKWQVRVSSASSSGSFKPMSIVLRELMG